MLNSIGIDLRSLACRERSDRSSQSLLSRLYGIPKTKSGPIFESVAQPVENSESIGTFNSDNHFTIFKVAIQVDIRNPQWNILSSFKLEVFSCKTFSVAVAFN